MTYRRREISVEPAPISRETLSTMTLQQLRDAYRQARAARHQAEAEVLEREISFRQSTNDFH